MKLQNEALWALYNAGLWTRNDRKVGGGVGRIYEIRTPSGPQWVKLHTRSYEPRHRYWVGINYAAVDSASFCSLVDAFVFWFRNEGHLYVVPADFLRKIIGSRPDRKHLTLIGGQWHVNIYAGDDTLELPRRGFRESLLDYKLPIPPPADFAFPIARPDVA